MIKKHWWKLLIFGLLIGLTMGAVQDAHAATLAVHVSWKVHVTEQISCPDPSDPNFAIANKPFLISDSTTRCDKQGHCQNITVASVGIIPMPSKICTQENVINRSRIFDTRAEAYAFIKAGCIDEDCGDWVVRSAVESDCPPNHPYCLSQI